MYLDRESGTLSDTDLPLSAPGIRHNTVDYVTGATPMDCVHFYGLCSTLKLTIRARKWIPLCLHKIQALGLTTEEVICICQAIPRRNIYIKHRDPQSNTQFKELVFFATQRMTGEYHRWLDYTPMAQTEQDNFRHYVEGRLGFNGGEKRIHQMVKYHELMYKTYRQRISNPAVSVEEQTPKTKQSEPTSHSCKLKSSAVSTKL
jgi:hypothetical protein